LGQTDYAVKIMEKRFIKREHKAHFVMMERNVLSRAAGHPLIIRLAYTFQDADYLYIVLDCAK
jgi:3-phosphoinositide dependent protein kinase-1